MVALGMQRGGPLGGPKALGAIRWTSGAVPIAVAVAVESARSCVRVSHPEAAAERADARTPHPATHWARHTNAPNHECRKGTPEPQCALLIQRKLPDQIETETARSDHTGNSISRYFGSG